MSADSVTLDDEVAALLREEAEQPAEAARELIVIELYRRGRISGGRAAELLGMSRAAFIRYGADLDIPYFRMTDEEWDEEVARIRARG